MKVSIHQPAYLPWLGYLDRIASSDVFVFLDTVQFEKGSFTNRNRIKTDRGPQWLTVPVHTAGHLGKTLIDLEIDDSRDWRTKHRRAIEQNYGHAAHFAGNQQRLADLFAPGEPRLAPLCFAQLHFWLREFGISTRIVRASDLPVEGRGSDLVLALCRRLEATTYLSGPFGRRYLDDDRLAAAGIRVEYHDYRHPVYPQPGSNFTPGLSAVDYWMHCGSRGPFNCTS